ncbi:MAG: hypothetical protein IJS61_00735 [Firmicutes bacterium]|nr:hypothetical protein [Bacillota bacterium]
MTASDYEIEGRIVPDTKGKNGKRFREFLEDIPSGNCYAEVEKDGSVSFASWSDGLVEKSKAQVAESNARSVYSSACGFAAMNDYELIGRITPSTKGSKSDMSFREFIGYGMTGSFYAETDEQGTVYYASWTEGDYVGEYTIDTVTGNSKASSYKS